jgi:hypothetical protein
MGMLRMLTYRTLDSRVLDLGRLTAEETAFLDRCIAAYRDGVTWEALSRLVEGTDNPLLRETGGRVTPAIWEHPLYQAVRDLEDRVGIRQGQLGLARGDDPARDPFADEWIPTTEAAARKGVTLPGLHKAIKRGDVIARSTAPGRIRLIVSVNSLDSWSPNPVRQAARRVG